VETAVPTIETDSAATHLANIGSARTTPNIDEVLTRRPPS
jgi:hypothetical protein